MTSFFDFEKVYSYNGEVSLWKVDDRLLKANPTVFTNMHSLLFVKILHEELVIKVNNSIIRINKSCIIDVLDSYQLEFVSVPNSVSAFHLFYSHVFFMEIFKSKMPFPISYVAKIKIDPILYLENTWIDLLLIQVHRIKEALNDNKNIYQKEILVNEFSTLLLEYSNIIVREKFPQENSSLGNKDYLAMQFTHILVSDGKVKHCVGFYANKLRVSNQYLARIVKYATGRTVHYWINEYLIFEIMGLLKEKNMSLQQIADKMSFSDQAAITKFFKKHTGILPSEFKKGCPINKTDIG